MMAASNLRTNEHMLLRPQFKIFTDLLLTSIEEENKMFKESTEWFEELLSTMKNQAKSLSRNKLAVPQNQKDTVKKKGRRQKQDGILSTTNLFEDTNTMDDTSASMRPRRAAARNAHEKIKQGNIPLFKKLRRPTNFDSLSNTQKRLQTDPQQPPSKYSRVRNDQSAGSNSLSNKDVNDDEKREISSSKMGAELELNLNAYVRLSYMKEVKMPASENYTCENEQDVQANSAEVETFVVPKNKDKSAINAGKNNLKTKPNCLSTKEVDCAILIKLDETYIADSNKTDLKLKQPLLCDGNQKNCLMTENGNIIEASSTDEKSLPKKQGRFTRKKQNETISILDSEVITSENSRTQIKGLKKNCEDRDIQGTVDDDSAVKNTVEPKTRTKVIRKKQNNVDNEDKDLDNVVNLDTEYEAKEREDCKTTKIMKSKQEECDSIENVDTDFETKQQELTEFTITKVLKKPQDDLGDVNNFFTKTEVETTCESRTRTKVIKKKQEDMRHVEPIVQAQADGTVRSLLETAEDQNEKGAVKDGVTNTLNKEDWCTNATKEIESTKTESHQVSENGCRSPAETIKNKNVDENDCLDQTYTKTNIRKHECQTRTKTIKKHIDLHQSPKLNDGKIVDDNRLLSPSSNELVKKRVEEYEKLQEESKRNEECGRVTRTKTRAMAKEDAKAKGLKTGNQQTSDSESDRKARIIQKSKKDKENIDVSAYSKIIEVHSRFVNKEKQKGTPLSNHNYLTTPGSDSVKKFVCTESHVETVQKVTKHADDGRQKKKEEIMKRLKKGDQARKNKEKTLKATAEETRRKREERLQKAAAAREENERQRAMLVAQAEKEREEKLRAVAAEKEKQKEEQAKKKVAAQLKTQEIEERRKQEEAARLAKLREQEEEHRRLEAIRQRELDAAAEQHKKRIAEELMAQEAEKNKEKAKQVKPPLKQKHQQQVVKPNAKLGKIVSSTTNSYHITPARNERPLMKPKNENDYGLDHAVSGDESSEDEDRPKKVIPKWAQAAKRVEPLKLQSHLPTKTWDIFMTCKPTVDLSELFGSKLARARTSSQYWATPPDIKSINSCA